MDELTRALVDAATYFGLAQAARMAEVVAAAEQAKGNDAGAKALRNFSAVLREQLPPACASPPSSSS